MLETLTSYCWLSSASDDLWFIKRLNDTFEENSGKRIQEVKSGEEEYDNNRYYFFALDESRCSVLSAASEILVKKSTCIWVGVN